MFRNGGILRYYEKWYFNGVAIETVSAYKYMGLFITTKLIWSYAKHNLAAQARKSIISMLKLQSSVGYFGYPELFKLFDTMIKPILLYGSEYGGLKNPIQLNMPLYVDYYCRCIRYCIRLTRMSSVRYPNKCYKMLQNLDESGRITWASKIKNLQFRNGFGYVWHVEDVGDQTLFMKTVKQMLIDCSKQDWSTVIAQSGKTRH